MRTLSQFTNKFSLSKTIRNELLPINSNGERMQEEEADAFFQDMLEQDKKINQAYCALKPILDNLHEMLITKSLESDDAKKIDFSEYVDKYKSKKINDKDEKDLMTKICKTYIIGAKHFLENAGIDKKGNPILKKNDYQCLTESGILKYIEKKIATLIPANIRKEFLFVEEKTNEKGKKIEMRSGHLEVMSRFFTFFDNYNNNRKNYYSAKGESTAVATRIVNDNLPKFCDNIFLFEARKDEYKNCYQYLKDRNRDTQIKDSKTNLYIEAQVIDERLFQISKFNNCLTQQEIENYNEIIGHYNLLINLYNQIRKSDGSFKQLEQFKTLYKQIGCGDKKTYVNQIKYDTHQEQVGAENEIEEVLNLEDILKEYAEIGNKYFTRSTVYVTLYTFIDKLKEVKQWNGIYWNKSAIDFISNKYFANWHTVKDKIFEGLSSKDKDAKLKSKSIASYDKNRNEQYKINDAVELSSLFEFLDDKLESGWSLTFFKESVLTDYFVDESLTPSQNVINLIIADLKKNAETFINDSKPVLAINDYKNDDNILTIKNWLDSTKPIFGSLKNFIVKENKVKGNPVNSEIINLINDILNPYEKDFDWNRSYDLIRNYLTRKPQEDAKKNKLKLNFDNPILLGGWSDGQEKAKSSVILKNDQKYFVGILIERNLFDTSKKMNPIYKGNDTETGRLLLKSVAFKTLAGKGFVRDYKQKYSELGKSNPQDAINKLKLLIKRDYINRYPLLEEVVDKNYSDKKLFEKDVNELLSDSYVCEFKPIDWQYILDQVEKKQLYLFEIYNKDFSLTKGEKSKGSKLNLHTLYWNHIFDNDSTIKLNGGGEIFYREKVKFDKVIVHKKDKPIEKRTDKKTESIFSHDITKDKRFLSNKFYLHIPITLNYKANKLLSNSFLNDEFLKNEKVQFLGIDRGEKHLIYYSLLDANGKIIKQNHFDILNHKDYLKTIKDAAETRRKRQENWQQKGNISNLKEGYLSLVVNQIMKLMKDDTGNYTPTYIVLEDLNKGFKRSRQKFEEQTYQKFETAIAKKFNYLVDKESKDDALGSIRNAIQLTPEVKTYADIEKSKQYGNMLYVRANYTSVTDPETGWRKTIYLKNGSKDVIKKQIQELFTEIGIDDNGDYFFKYVDENLGKEWKLWSGKNGKSLERYRAKRGKDKNEYIIEPFFVKDMLDGLFANFDKSKSLLTQINTVELLKINEYPAWESLRFVIDIIQQIRNSGDTDKGQDDNFLLSPVRNANGEHYDSRISDGKLPVDADANGAYNIARKGIMMMEHFKQWMLDGKIEGDLDLFISDKEWDLWNVNRAEWEKQVKVFSSRKLKNQ